MIFKNFDVDYDKLTIDEFVISRPSYIGIKEWLDFWEFAQQAEIHGSYARSIDKAEAEAFQDGKEESEKEHERELEDQIRDFEKNAERAITRIESGAEFYEVYNEDFLRKVREIVCDMVPEL